MDLSPDRWLRRTRIFAVRVRGALSRIGAQSTVFAFPSRASLEIRELGNQDDLSSSRREEADRRCQSVDAPVICESGYDQRVRRNDECNARVHEHPKSLRPLPLGTIQEARIIFHQTLKR